MKGNFDMRKLEEVKGILLNNKYNTIKTHILYLIRTYDIII